MTFNDNVNFLFKKIALQKNQALENILHEKVTI